MTRYALRVDVNQALCITALEAAGFQVDVIGKPLDLLVGKGGKFMFIEIKRDSKAKRTPAQEKFFARWQGYPISLADSPETAVRHARMLEL